MSSRLWIVVISVGRRRLSRLWVTRLKAVVRVRVRQIVWITRVKQQVWITRVEVRRWKINCCLITQLLKVSIWMKNPSMRKKQISKKINNRNKMNMATTTYLLNQIMATKYSKAELIKTEILKTTGKIFLTLKKID